MTVSDAAENRDGESQRLHPSSLLFGIGAVARRLLVPGLAILFFSRRQEPEVWVMVLFAPSAVLAVVRYWAYRYRLGAEELVIQDGLLTRNERHIPYARIQNIDLVQNPLQRLLGVAEARLETAAGGKPEAVIRVLSLEAIAVMRARIFVGQPPAPGEGEAAPERPHAILEVGFLDQVRYGVISNRGMVVVAAAIGVAWQFGPLGSWFEALQRQFFDLPLLRWGAPGVLAIIVLALIAATPFLWLLSIGLALVRLHGYSLRRDGENLRAEYGLFTRVTKTVPRHRIQRLVVRQSVMHRILGCASVVVDTAGGGSGEEGDPHGAARIEVVPIVPKDRIEPLLAELLPDLDLGAVAWSELAPRAPRRMFRQWIAVLAVLGGALAFAHPALALVAPLLAPLAWLETRARMKRTAWSVDKGYVCRRSGIFWRRLDLVRWSKIQVVQSRESPFDRRHRMASLVIDTAGAGAEGPLSIDLLDAGQARQALGQLATEAGRTAFRW